MSDHFTHSCSEKKSELFYCIPSFLVKNGIEAITKYTYIAK